MLKAAEEAREKAKNREDAFEHVMVQWSEQAESIPG